MTAAQTGELPLVSIMIPTFNQAQYLTEAVESALAQDYPHLEIVICDDASSDDTAAIGRGLAARDPRIRFHRNDGNLGRVANYRHLLYDLAQGEWVLNLDGDDALLDRAYVRQAIERAQSDPDLVLVFAKALKGERADGSGTVLNDAPAMPPVMDGTQFLLHFPPLETIAPLHASGRTAKSSTSSALEARKIRIQRRRVAPGGEPCT